MNSEANLIFGNNVKNERLKKGLSQIELANLCEFEKGNMNRIEQGKTNPTLQTMVKIANSLEIPVVFLLKDI